MYVLDLNTLAGRTVAQNMFEMGQNYFLLDLKL